MGKIADTLSKLGSGEIDMPEAAARLRGMRDFPPVSEPSVTALLGGDDRPYGDDEEDDGHELTDARNMGDITPQEYAILHAAYSQARAG